MEERKAPAPGWQRPAQQVHGEERRKVHVQQLPVSPYSHPLNVSHQWEVFLQLFDVTWVPPLMREQHFRAGMDRNTHMQFSATALEFVR